MKTSSSPAITADVAPPDDLCFIIFMMPATMEAVLHSSIQINQVAKLGMLRGRLGVAATHRPPASSIVRLAYPSVL